MSSTSKTPNFDAKIQTVLDATKPGERVCVVTNETWMLSNEEIRWLNKFNIPVCKLSPTARRKQRTASYTGYQFWYNKDAKTGKPILTHVHPASLWKVMEDEAWFQEDFSSQGLEFNTQRPFFDLMEDLIRRVPVNANRHFRKPENSLCTISFGDVDSYFTVATKSRRSFYCADAFEIEDCMEVFVGHDITRSFDVFHCDHMSECKVARECRECFNCSFIFDCRNCESCFFSWNQRHKKYLWRNEQLSEGEWKQKMKEVDFGSRKTYQNLLAEFKTALAKEVVWPPNFNVNAQNSTGEYLTNCIDVEEGFFCDDSRDVSWSTYNALSHDLFHADGPKLTDCCMMGVAARCHDCKFCWIMVACRSCEYSINCYDCEFCFGCVGLNKKKFCIFNKQYEEKEYWQKLDELKCAMLERGEYGEGFHVRFSQGWPVQTGMGWLFSMTEEEIRPYQPLTFDPKDAGAFGPLADRAKEAVDSETLPDHIRDLGNEWAGKIFFDKEYGRPFTYQKHEIEFCKRFNIAPYTTHFLSRFWSHQHEMNSIIPLQVSCAKCGVSFRTSKNFAYPQRKIYCKTCYLKYLNAHD